MRRFVPQLEVANFHLTFGKHELIDYVRTIVFPAFLAPERVKYSGTGERSKWLHEVQFLEISTTKGKSTPVLAGKFVKHIVYRSNQVEVGGDLVLDDSTMPADPSSIFVLALDSHQLLYARQFPNSPILKEFETAMLWFVHKSRYEWIRQEKQRRVAKGEKITISELEDSIPAPKLEIVEVKSGKEMAVLVKNLKIVNSLKIEFVKTNNQGLVGSMLSPMYEGKVALGAEHMKVEATSKAGLNKTAASQAIAEVVDKGVARFVATGKDEHGATARLTEQTSEIKAPMPDLPMDVDRAAQRMIESNRGLEAEELLPPPPRPKETLTKLEEKLPSLRKLAQNFAQEAKENKA